MGGTQKGGSVVTSRGMNTKQGFKMEYRYRSFAISASKVLYEGVEPLVPVVQRLDKDANSYWMAQQVW